MSYLNPKYQRYADRLRELIEEGPSIAKQARYMSHEFGGHHEISEIGLAQTHSWISRTRNILVLIFGKDNPRTTHFEADIKGHVLYSPTTVYTIVGHLQGAYDDLTHGFLTSQEFLIAGEVFDTVLEQAKHLNNSGYKDVAAVLGRVVIEDALKRIAREEGIDEDQKTTMLNDQLWKANRYSKPQWRQVQVWLDIGNSAAHGQFHEYTTEKVGEMLEGILSFIALELR